MDHFGRSGTVPNRVILGHSGTDLSALGGRYCDDAAAIYSEACSDQFPAKVSIVIPCHNAIDITMLSLTSVIHNRDIPFELVLVNDGSTDSTAASLDRLAANINAGQYPKVTGVRVLHNSKRTSCAEASNLGVAAASGDIIVWCNNDMLYGPHWLSPLVKIVATDANVGVVRPGRLKSHSIITKAAVL